MTTVLIILGAWTLVSFPFAVIIGRAISKADERERESEQTERLSAFLAA